MTFVHRFPTPSWFSFLLLLLASAPIPPAGAQNSPPAPAATPAAAAPAPAAPPATSAAGTLTINTGPDGITLFALKVDAGELFTELGRRTKTRIVVDDTVNRQITVRLHAATVTDAINSIVAAYGLSTAVVNGVTMISEGIPNNPSSYLLSDIDTITTRYVLAPNAKVLLPVFLQDHVKINPEQNAVVLSAPTEVLRKFRQDIRQFDVPAQQIMIEALMVEHTDSNDQSFDLALGLSNVGNATTTDAGTGAVTFKSLRVLPRDFNAHLTALVERGKARIRANPRIATVSGQPASIFIGQQRFLSTPVEVRTQNNGNNFNTQQVNFIDAGITLNLTPYTGGGGEIIVEVHTEVSVLGAPDPITHLPDKTTRQADTVVRLRDGETLIIGGLTQQEDNDTRTKIPILGDLPIIGGLFRSRIRSRTHTDLTIFLTPHILSSTGHSSPAEEARLKKEFLDAPQGKGLSKAAPAGGLAVPGPVK